MKDNKSIGPAAIVGAVIILALIIFVIYHFAFATKPMLPQTKPTSSGYGPKSALSMHSVPGGGEAPVGQ